MCIYLNDRELFFLHLENAKGYVLSNAGTLINQILQNRVQEFHQIQTLWHLLVMFTT